MDLILFLVFAGLVIYFNQIKPKLDEKKAVRQQQLNETSQLRKTPRLTKAPSALPTRSSPTTTQSVANRPTVPALLGIEITASQQRRLGKNDPSVLAAQRAKQLNQTQHSGSTWFEQLTSQVEHVLQQPNDAAKHQSTASNTQQKSAFNKMFEDLFSK